MPAAVKAKTLMAPAKRVELWLIYSAAYSFVALCVFWKLGERYTEDPLVRLLFVGQLVLVYAMIAVLVRQFYEKDGKRSRKQVPQPAPAADSGAA